MEGLKVALFTDDKDYGESLCRCVRKLQPVVNMSLCDDESDIGKYDFVLLDKGKAGMTCKCGSIPYAVLCEDDESLSEREIYKYGKVSDVVRDMVEIYEEETQIYVNTVFDNRECNIYTVSSAHGGMGVSSIAYAMARDYALSSNEKVLYISLGKYHEEKLFFKNNKDLNLKDLLFRIFYNNTEQKKINLERYMVKDDVGVCALNVIGVENQLVILEKSKFVAFVKRLIESGLFTKIIVDVGSNICENAKYFYKIAYKNIYIKGKFDTTFETDLMMKMEFESENIVVVENFRYKGNPKFDEFFETENKLSENIDMGISYDEGSFSCVDGMMSIDINGEFGMCIRELINIIAFTKV